MSIRRDIQLLQQVPAFAGVDVAHLQLLLFSAKTVKVKTGQLLIKQNEKGDSAYLILDGRAEALAAEGTGLEMIAELEAGAFVGELAMIAKLPYRVTVRAKTPLSAAQIPHDLFMRVVKEFPEVGARVMSGLAASLQDNVCKLKDVRELFERSEQFP